ISFQPHLNAFFTFKLRAQQHCCSHRTAQEYRVEHGEAMFFACGFNNISSLYDGNFKIPAIINAFNKTVLLLKIFFGNHKRVLLVRTQLKISCLLPKLKNEIWLICIVLYLILLKYPYL